MVNSISDRRLKVIIWYIKSNREESVVEIDPSAFLMSNVYLLSISLLRMLKDKIPEFEAADFFLKIILEVHFCHTSLSLFLKKTLFYVLAEFVWSKRRKILYRMWSMFSS